jgi:hypothetical protein
MKLAAGRPIVEVIELAYRSNKSVMLEGRHGVGKSCLFHTAAQELGVDVIVRDLSLMEPPDLVGIPQIDGDATIFAAPSFLPRGGSGILVFEELNRCPRYMRSSCLELLTSRRLNDYTLPPGWVPMAAINPACDEYIDAEELDAALMSRFVRIEVVASVDEWCRWARQNHVHEQIVQFVEQSPGAFDTKGPSPRSWTYASDLLIAWESNSDRDEEVLAAALAGVLLDEWALAFLQFFQHGFKPLTAKLIIHDYPALRSTARQWVTVGKLDLIAASLESLKRHLQRQQDYDTVVADTNQKANVETFLGDLPPDLKRQAKDWLEDRDFNNLRVPRKPRK